MEAAWGFHYLESPPSPCLSSLREVCVSCLSFVPLSCPLLLPQPVLEFFNLFLIGYSGTSRASQERPLFQIVKSVCISVCASRPADNDLVSIFVTLGMSGKKGRLCKRLGCYRNCLLQSPPQITQPSHWKKSPVMGGQTDRHLDYCYWTQSWPKNSLNSI